MKLKCPKCNKKLLWGADFDYEDYGLEGGGIVGKYTCTNEECDVETVTIYTEDK